MLKTTKEILNLCDTVIKASTVPLDFQNYNKDTQIYACWFKNFSISAHLYKERGSSCVFVEIDEATDVNNAKTFDVTTEYYSPEKTDADYAAEKTRIDSRTCQECKTVAFSIFYMLKLRITKLERMGLPVLGSKNHPAAQIHEKFLHRSARLISEQKQYS